MVRFMAQAVITTSKMDECTTAIAVSERTGIARLPENGQNGTKGAELFNEVEKLVSGKSNLGLLKNSAGTVDFNITSLIMFVTCFASRWWSAPGRVGGKCVEREGAAIG
jgi:hypothetical protein